MQTTRIEFLTLDVKNKKHEIDMLTDRKLALTDENDSNITIGDKLKRTLNDVQRNSDHTIEGYIRQFKKLLVENVKIAKAAEDNEMLCEDYRSQIQIREEELKHTKSCLRSETERRAEAEELNKAHEDSIAFLKKERQKLQKKHTQLTEAHETLSSNYKQF